jgi:predicted PurR-regulated permease PerM
MNAGKPIPRWSSETKRWAIIGVIVILGALIYYARSALSWLVVAALLAYLLQPIVNWLDDHGLPRALAAVVALLIAIGILVIIPLALMPMLLNQFGQLLESLLKATLHGVDAFNQWMATSGVVSIFGFKVNLQEAAGSY